MFLTLVQLVSTFITYITVLYNVHRLGTFSKRYWSIFCWPINGQTWWPSKKYNGVKFSTIREVISFWVSHYQWSWDCSWRSHIWTDSAVLIGYINQWEGRLTRIGSAHKRHIPVQTQASFGCTSIYFFGGPFSWRGSWSRSSCSASRFKPTSCSRGRQAQVLVSAGLMFHVSIIRSTKASS